MARTNEEINMELSEPVAVHFHGGNPEPHMTPRSYLALEELHAEALALIQRLQEKNEAMHAEIARLQAERDALLKYITDSSWAACDICKHGIDGASAMNCKHIREVGVPCFEWRGVQKEALSC